MATTEVVVFDVNETLSDMSAVAARFVEVGAPEHLAALWFASLLRDGFAATAAGGQIGFSDLGRGTLRTVLSGLDVNRSPHDAVEHVMDGFMTLAVHPDVVEGVRALRRSGLRLTTLSNGSVEVAERLLTAAGVRDAFDALLSVEDAGVWKPAKAAYEYGARVCQSDPSVMLLVAVHPWDIHGASNAGLRTAWINRSGAPYPAYFAAPDHTVGSLPELAEQLAR
ncbi:MAG: haloacid dehalogenase type II [Propionibacteriales bacterium]|nr:haloacid dehalogenase type II [Propionibacteriales bacterium]